MSIIAQIQWNNWVNLNSDFTSELKGKSWRKQSGLSFVPSQSKFSRRRWWEISLTPLQSYLYTPVAVFSSAFADDSLDRLRLYLILDSYRIKPTVMRAPAQWAPEGRSGRRRWSRRLRTRWPWWWSMRPWLGHMLGGTEQHWAILSQAEARGAPPHEVTGPTADNKIHTQPWPLFMSSLIRQNYFIRSR